MSPAASAMGQKSEGYLAPTAREEKGLGLDRSSSSEKKEQRPRASFTGDGQYLTPAPARVRPVARRERKRRAEATRRANIIPGAVEFAVATTPRENRRKAGWVALSESLLPPPLMRSQLGFETPPLGRPVEKGDGVYSKIHKKMRIGVSGSSDLPPSNERTLILM